jgi:hypothetical protein
MYLWRPITNLITSLIPILLFEYFKEKSWLTTSKVGLLIFQLSITEVSSALDHSNMWSSVGNGRQVNDFIANRLVAKSGLWRSKDKSPVPSLFKQCICEGLLQIFCNEIRLITKRILNPNNIFIIQNWHDITKKIAEQTNRLPEQC